jgi:predicted choloylglycine hydrolase
MTNFGYDWEHLTGSYHEIGVQHGRENAERMRYLLKAFGVSLDGPWTEAEFLTPLVKHLPDLAEELHGIAVGSQMSLREVIALSFLIDLSTSASSACTGVVFADGPDGPVVGKTSDCTPGIQQEWLRPRRIKPTHGYAAIMHSHVGSPNAEMGMNERGLAIGISGLLSRQTDRNGVGWQQDIRGVLHACATTSEAIEMLARVPIRKAGYAMVIGDADGDVAVVEKVVGKIAVRRPQGNVAFEANIARCSDVLPFVDPSWCGENGERRTALLDRLTRQQPWRDFSLNGMIDLFAMHDDPVGICQHGPALHSQTGFFMLPRKRELWLARGYTCQRNLECVRFDND